MSTTHIIRELIESLGVHTDECILSTPPAPEQGDIAFAAFAYAKRCSMSPVDAAQHLAEQIRAIAHPSIFEVAVVGPYINLFLNPQVVAAEVFSPTPIQAIFSGKTVLVEYGCQNPLKVFHLGHLKNLVTGESLARMVEAVGATVIRVNYQGDVGMHVAKALWGIQEDMAGFEAMRTAPLPDRSAFLGAAYARGAQAYENDPQKKEEIETMNARIYTKDPEIMPIYTEARSWSLDYFELVYARLNTHYAAYYFESEMTEPARAIVAEFVEKGVFEHSDGAVIFRGSAHGLHDRVFLNSKGFPTYEGKDIALAQVRYSTYPIDHLFHLVGKEQTEYFKVVLCALSFVVPESVGKSEHIPGGFLQLTSGKMSSRTGQVVAGDALIDLVHSRVSEIMADRTLVEKDTVVERVAMAALKYSMLKVQVSTDVAFDMEESVNVSGESGPYILYTVARLQRLLEKSGLPAQGVNVSIPKTIVQSEKQLLLLLEQYSDTVVRAVLARDPSIIAGYVYRLARQSTEWYHDQPILDVPEETIRLFRLELVRASVDILTQGLHLLGIETVREM